MIGIVRQTVNACRVACMKALMRIGPYIAALQSVAVVSAMCALSIGMVGCSDEAAPGGDDAEDGGGADGDTAGHGPVDGGAGDGAVGDGQGGGGGDGQPGDEGGDAGNGGDGGDAGDGGAGDGDGGGVGDDPLGPPVPQGYVKRCLGTCAGPEDCPPEGLGDAGTGAHTPAHYACEEGACRYLGCGDDEQCKVSYIDTYACKPPKTGGAPLQCTVPCIVDADCAKTARPHDDLDNWACLDGGCLYRGCNSTEECRLGRGDGFVCRAVTGGVPTCFETCGPGPGGGPNPGDGACGGNDALFDADNHVCDGGSVSITVRADGGCHVYRASVLPTAKALAHRPYGVDNRGRGL